MPLRLFINKPIRLQRLLLLALLLVLLPVVLVQAGFSYQIAQQSSLKFQEQLASEISARIFYRVTNFFEIPRQVVRYNVEQFRSGILDTHNTPRASAKLSATTRSTAAVDLRFHGQCTG